MSKVSITVPDDHEALCAAAVFMRVLAKRHTEQEQAPKDGGVWEPTKAEAEKLKTPDTDPISQPDGPVPDKPTPDADEPDTTAPPPPAGVELDSKGLPWDHRIHSSSRSKLKKSGEWKLKRGIDEAHVEQVKAELRRAMSANPQPAPPAPPLAKEDPTEPEADSAQQTFAPPPPPPGDAPFPAFMKSYTAAQIPVERVKEVCAAHGLDSVALLASRPDLIPAIREELGL